MAEERRLGRETKLNSHNGKQPIYWRHEEDTDAMSKAQRPSVRNTTDSEETIRATKPINIPGESCEHAIVEDPAQIDGLTIDTFLRTRQPSISFNTEVRLDSGHHQSMVEPLSKPSNQGRGRSLAQALYNAQTETARAHSESEREQYDRTTGRHLPKYSNSPAREHARIGEARFPLLQATVDSMARESHGELPNLSSLTSDSTFSPVDEPARTPPDTQEDFGRSPSSTFPFARASSFEAPYPFKRTASQRWREGEKSADFFQRAHPRKSSTGNGRSGRRTTVGSVRSPHSAASSFLRAFSTGSREDEASEGDSAGDAEGETVGENYVMGKQIGFGGFSVIKEVTQLLPDGSQRKLAAKIVKRSLEGKSEQENEHAQAEFEHEVDLWRRLNHPRILQLEEVYVTEAATFCFIPLNKGGTLFDLIRKHRQGLPLPLVKRYTYQLASALRYLHQDAHVAHRDVKLENILLDHSPDVKSASMSTNVSLCDFGMAEWILQDDRAGSPDAMNRGGHSSDDSRPPTPDPDRPPMRHLGPADTSTSAFTGGSLDYAAPEILRVASSLQPLISAADNNKDSQSGRSSTTLLQPVAVDDSDQRQQDHHHPISAAVDIWALGVCVYAMITGSRPFSNAFQPRVVMSILAGDWERDLLRSKVEGAADCATATQALQLIESCLEMDWRKRCRVGDVLDSEFLSGVTDNDDEEDVDEHDVRGKEDSRRPAGGADGAVDDDDDRDNDDEDEGMSMKKTWRL